MSLKEVDVIEKFPDMHIYNIVKKAINLKVLSFSNFHQYSEYSHTVSTFDIDVFNHLNHLSIAV